MQPMAGPNAADLLVKPGEGAARAGVPVNSEAFWAKKVEDVAADEVFFHSYFSQAGKKKKPTAKAEKKRKRDEEDEEGSEDEGEEEIWQAIAQSRPDVEGPDEDDDLSFGDFESVEESDAGSEPGIDLGGGDEGAGAETDFAEMDGFPALDSDDDALLGSEDEAAMDVEEEPEEDLSRNKKKRKEKKKLKALPTFASADDYARMLADEPDDM